jgi:protein-L-isoaspartate(D-aspartate) O-methyltransferase
MNMGPQVLKVPEVEARALLERYARMTSDLPLSEAVLRAFNENPRHVFALEARPDLKGEGMGFFYGDEPLILSAGATISQPTFVLFILESMKIAPGQRILEIGTGSGWSAGMLASLVGESGHVVTIEIQPELAQAARESLKRLGHKNCTVITGDGGFGYAPGAPYDRVIFTAGASEIPPAIFEQTSPSGKLAWVWSHGEEWDDLVFFDREGEGFRSEKTIPCSFVPLTGAFAERGSLSRFRGPGKGFAIRAFLSRQAPAPIRGEKRSEGERTTLLFRPL